jgi:SAM-dependent methyltransferase
VLCVGAKGKLAKAGLLGRIDAQLIDPSSMGLADLAGAVDFAFAFVVVQEFPANNSFFSEVSQVLKAGACLLIAEPRGHVSAAQFQAELAESPRRPSLRLAERPSIRHSHDALLKKG